MSKTKKLLTCEICSLPDGIPYLKLAEVATEQGNYYACPSCLLHEQLVETYQTLGRLIDRQRFYFQTLSRHYHRHLKNHD